MADFDDEFARFTSEIAQVDETSLLPKFVAFQAPQPSTSSGFIPAKVRKTVKTKTSEPMGIIASAPVRYDASGKPEPPPAAPIPPTIKKAETPPPPPPIQSESQKAISALNSDIIAMEMKRARDARARGDYYYSPLLPADWAPAVNDTEVVKARLRAAAQSDKKHLRMAGGRIWEDNALEEWDPNDYRMFVGNLGNEVSDELLAKSFRTFTSFQKAKVLRHRHNNKSKGYGFVSFKDPDDFARAMREMNGKYIGNRPCRLFRSDWKEREFLNAKKEGKKTFKRPY